MSQELYKNLLRIVNPTPDERVKSKKVRKQATQPLKFTLGNIVQHRVTEDLYVITGLPTSNRIEATGEPAYGYTDQFGDTWWRSQFEMEDGRFATCDVRTVDEF